MEALWIHGLARSAAVHLDGIELQARRVYAQGREPYGRKVLLGSGSSSRRRKPSHRALPTGY